jgi:hypothetical protein
MRSGISAVAGAALVIAATACTSGGRETASTTGVTQASIGPSNPGGLTLGATRCPTGGWKYTSIPGSDSAIAPGVPTLGVACSRDIQGRRINAVIQGSRLTNVVDVLNGLPSVPLKTCLHNYGGERSIQLYLSYSTGDIQVVNVEPSCTTVSNGERTALLKTMLPLFH